MTLINLPSDPTAETLRRVICHALPDLSQEIVIALDKAGRDPAAVLRALLEAREDVRPVWPEGGEA